MTQSDLGIFCSLYKSEEFLEEYLQDLLRQSIFEEVNFYLVGCESSEEEIAILTPYLKEYKNIVFHSASPDPGLYAAWNIGVNLSSEKFIGNWNVDDRRSPWSLEILLDAIKSDDTLDLVYGKTLETNIPNETWDTTKATKFFPCYPHSFETLKKVNSPHCMPIWRRNLHDRFGYFDNSYKSAADADMWLRACAGGAKMKMVDEVVGIYYHNPKGRSTAKENMPFLVKEIQRLYSQYR